VHLGSEHHCGLKMINFGQLNVVLSASVVDITSEMF